MIIKCKMCGGDIQFNLGDTFGQCEYCGSTSTIPKADDEQKLNRYNRANHFRRQCEFDKAITAYERILEEDDTDAEAHWGIVLSRYGIEYVEDPVTKRRVPTCHRVQLESILADADYLAAIENAPDAESKKLYVEQAKEIAEIQKGILAISANEKPYDVFICYKETDDSGERTRDSALAQDVYYGLVEQGYKVFFSRITLEDKLGQQYEPYIFAALNSARVMIVIGTKPEYFNAVWVKNEWSRYLHLMKNDRKRLLIPCYRDMDPYDLPDELSNLQSQDMSKIGFMQDLLRGVRKVLEAEKAKSIPQQAAVPETGVQNVGSPVAPGVDSLLKRAYLFMEDGDFKNAADYLDRVLDIDPECSSAYAAKVCVAYGFKKESELGKSTILFEENLDWKKAVRFADAQKKKTYEGYLSEVKDRVQMQIRNYAYDCAIEMAVMPGSDRGKLDKELSEYSHICCHSSEKQLIIIRRSKSIQNEEIFRNAVSQNDPGNVSEQELKTAANMLEKIGDQEAVQSAKQCIQLAEQARQKAIFLQAESISHTKNDPLELDKAAQVFMSVPEYKDAKAEAKRCADAAEKIRSELYSAAVNDMESAGSKSVKWEEVKSKLADKRLNNYRDINELRTQAAKKHEEALAGEKEAKRQAEERLRQKEEAAVRQQKRITSVTIIALILTIAIVLVVTLVIIPNSKYQEAVSLRDSGNYTEAVEMFTSLGDYRDSATQIEMTYYTEGMAKQREGSWDEAITAFNKAGDYSDSETQISETKYLHAKALISTGNYDSAFVILTYLKGYKDVDDLLKNDNNLLAARAARLELYQTVGSYVTLGTYPQTVEGTDQTPIEWLVLDYDETNHKTLLLSRYGLENMPYNQKLAYITWEECTLRAWLNGEFLNKAFSASERKAILVTTVDNRSGQGYSEWYMYGENYTKDCIFLLSYAEANRYLNLTYTNKNNTKSRVAPTAYASSKGFRADDSYKTEDGECAGWWWLRSRGLAKNDAAGVNRDGSLSNAYVNENYFYQLVRPACWLNLEAFDF